MFIYSRCVSVFDDITSVRVSDLLSKTFKLKRRIFPVLSPEIKLRIDKCMNSIQLILCCIHLNTTNKRFIANLKLLIG